jgi:putative ABC transport system permease protein
VRGGFGTGSTLTLADANALAEKSNAPDIKAVDAEKSSSEELTAGSTNWTTTVDGVTPSYRSVRSRTVESGSFITQAQVNANAAVVVLGSETADELFGSTNVVGQSVTIDSQSFEVIGVLAPSGSSSTTDLDDLALVPLSTMQQDLVGGTSANSVSTVYLQATSADALPAAYQEAKSLLLNRHDITDSSDADFSISSQNALVSTATSVYKTLTVLLTGIAALSLLVGGIGVMNIMLVSVSERTREIGLRKALGAPPGAIRNQFLVEAAILGLTGGIVGAGLGVLAALTLPAAIGSTIVISGAAVGLSLVVAIGIGLVFGVYPATRAARLAPIDALRTE